MQRRAFLQTAALSAAARLQLLAQTPMPTATLGRSGLRVSRFTLGGYHMLVQGEQECLRIIARALDLGVNFFDSAYHYNKGESDRVLGKALSGAERQKVILMTKFERYSKAEAMAGLEEQLKRLRTDYIDLWQVHQVARHDEADQVLGPDGSLEAFIQAKKQGKVRHIGFTGHHDPSVHLKLLRGYDGWETIQMPINLVDPHYESFITNVLPEARKMGLGVIAMKSNAMGAITRNNVAPIEECLRFTLAQDIDTLVSGVESVAQLEANVLTVKTQPQLTPAELSAILARTAQGQTGTPIERYKKGTPTARLHHDGQRA
ncbi:MAG: aldo/keto reductase [Bryobacteraceae bacterium]|nr:aldo/keto reductase [Solibacteraceae bacterium]MCO5349376.1 aldo/keto reductase [Bryobacteraceae bacterium]